MLDPYIVYVQTNNTMKPLTPWLLLSFLCLCASLPLSSQSSSEIGLFFSTTDYLGDLSRKVPGREDFGWGIGVNARYMVDPNMGVKFYMGYKDFTGSDRTVPRNADRGWETAFGLMEVSVSFEYHPFGRGRYNFVNVFNRYQLSPFFYLGVGAAMGDAEVFVPATDEGKFPEEADRDVFVALPMGGGLRFDLSEFCILTADFGFRAVFSDYLDGISQGSDRNDWYFTGGLSVSILLHGEPEKL